ncbi:hypothetical protein XI07_05165 [Bradyrhizobium sp. CCBAU 11445]|nr:hypothetical protein [Bradyrhizobium sp. CCBAU 11445]
MIFLSRIDQPLGDQARPSVLSLGIANQIVANFKQEVQQAAPLPMHRDRVVALIVDGIWLVVRTDRLRVALLKRAEETPGKATVTVGEHTELPGTSGPS